MHGGRRHAGCCSPVSTIRGLQEHGVEEVGGKRRRKSFKENKGDEEESLQRA